MKFYNFLNEKRKRSIIVVDIQPMYKNFFDFNIEDFVKFLLENGNILYFYNGPDTVEEDSKIDIINFLIENLEHSYYEYGEIDKDLYYKLSNETKWVDKGYGFFRG